ncbi:MAG: hypothetical protein ACKVIQ_17045, partial [Acidimicrobiales bacterium]
MVQGEQGLFVGTTPSGIEVASQEIDDAPQRIGLEEELPIKQRKRINFWRITKHHVVETETSMDERE